MTGGVTTTPAGPRQLTEPPPQQHPEQVQQRSRWARAAEVPGFLAHYSQEDDKASSSSCPGPPGSRLLVEGPTESTWTPPALTRSKVEGSRLTAEDRAGWAHGPSGPLLRV